MRRRKTKEDYLKRTNRYTIMFNDRELNALNAFFERYKISNRSRYMREAIITAILKKFDEDYPTLWEEKEPNLFSKNLN
ncbi:MAG: hypothetical protein JSV24_11860 [Bacteroidales bacterium]|nr:MAG: hypothetical protein JSV24_11860 [Bacteroidales bacterium]